MIEKNEHHHNFNNKNEELEYYKSKYESFFKELVKYQLKVKSLENSNNRLREKVSNYLNINSSKNTNNCESNFLTVSEFKKLWEYIVKTELIETFDFCINEYILIANLCQDIMLLVYEECKQYINNKFIEVLNCLNLGKISKDKREEIYSNFLPFFRDNFNKIFVFSDNFSETINSKLLLIIKEYDYNRDIINENTIETEEKDENNKDINANYISKLKEKINQNNFNNLIKSFYKICIYMILHEPPLNFDLEQYSKRKLKYFYFNNYDFINVDGFIKEKDPCIMLLSAPLIRNKFNFHNLRAPSYLVYNANKEIIDECQKKKNEEEKDMENMDNEKLMEFEGTNDEYIDDNKKNKTFEGKYIKINNRKDSPINNKILDESSSNKIHMKSSQNIIKSNAVYNNSIKFKDKKSKVKNDINILTNHSTNKTSKSSKINEISSNSIDSKILYIVSQPNKIKTNSKCNQTTLVQNYINNKGNTNSNSNYNIKKKNNKYKYSLSSSTGNIGVEIKKKNADNNKEGNNKKNNPQNDETIYGIIMENLNKLKETKLKEYYINNKNKNATKNKNSNYCIKNHIYTNIKNMPYTTNNRMTIRKNNHTSNTNSNHLDLILNKKISLSPSNLFKSNESYNNSTDVNYPSSPKNEKYKNYNSFTHLLKFSNMNSISSSNKPIISSQGSTTYNNLVLKGIKNIFETNINKSKNIKNSCNNINYIMNHKINNNVANINSNHSSNVTKNNFNPISNRKKYISYNTKNENKSELKERHSLNNYLSNKSNTSNSKQKTYNNNQRNSNIIKNKNNSQKNKKMQKKIIKNSIIISEGNIYNQKYYNCKKINNNIKNKNANLNNNRHKNNNISNNKIKKTNNYITYNYNIKNKENIYYSNNFNEESNMFKFSLNNTYVQKTINKSTSPESNYLNNNNNNLNDINEQNNILLHRNSNTTLYNNYFTSERENNLSTNKNNQKSFHEAKKTKRKISNNNYNTNTNNYIKNNKSKMNKHKENVIKYIKSIKLVNKYRTTNKKREGEINNQSILGLNQIYKNSKYNLQKPINSLPMEKYVKTEENNKKTPFKDIVTNNKFNKENKRQMNLK